MISTASPSPRSQAPQCSTPNSGSHLDSNCDSISLRARSFKTNSLRSDPNSGHSNSVQGDVVGSKRYESRANCQQAVSVSSATDLARIRSMVRKAMAAPDQFVIHFIYVTARKVSIRAVSPYRWKDSESFVGLCLSKETLRTFRLDGIHRVALVRTADILVPYPSTEALPTRV